MTINFVQLRLATRDDYDVIRSLVYDLDEMIYDRVRMGVKAPQRSELSEARFAAWLADRQMRLVVALLKEGVVGFSRVEVLERPESRTDPSRLIMKIHELIVRKRYRRRGIGALLFDDITTLARHFDIDRIELCVPHFNEGATRFFEGRGLLPLTCTMAREREG